MSKRGAGSMERRAGGRRKRKGFMVEQGVGRCQLAVGSSGALGVRREAVGKVGGRAVRQSRGNELLVKGKKWGGFSVGQCCGFSVFR